MIELLQLTLHIMASLFKPRAKLVSGKSSGIIATIIGIITLIVTASGVFGEMQTSLNAIWKAKPQGTTVSRLIRARATSLGLVAALGFLLMVSLVVSTALTAFGNYLDSILPFGKIIMTVLNGSLCQLARQDARRAGFGERTFTVTLTSVGAGYPL